MSVPYAYMLSQINIFLKDSYLILCMRQYWDSLNDPSKFQIIKLVIEFQIWVAFIIVVVIVYCC